MALQRDKIVGNAEKLVARGKIEPAIREYERLLGESPNDVNTLNRIGDLWVRIERNDEAVKVFRKIADHYSRDGFFLKAIAIYKKINKLDPSKLDIYAKLAELYAKQGLAMEAKSQYMVLADYYVKHEDVESAIGIYLKIAELDPHSVNVRIKLADLYTQHNQIPQALQEYDRVGRMLLKRGMSSEAVQVFRKALKLDSGNIDLAESVVSSLLEEKEHASAVEIVESALESNRENPRLIVLLATVHLSRGNAAAAHEVLEQGLSSNPNSFGIRQSLAELHLREGEHDKAVELIGPVLTARADRTEQTGAIQILEAIIAARPDHAAALEKLVDVYRRLDDPQAIDAMTRLANAHMERREYQQAETIFRDLARRDPENPLHRDRLAELAQETGSSAPDPAFAQIPDTDDLLDFSEEIPEEPSHATPNADVELPPVDPPAPAEITSEPEELEEETIDLEFDAEAESVEAPTPQRDSVAEKEDEAAAELREFVTEHLAEADVFAKYGLYDKAVEHLQTVIGKAPRNRAAYEKLLNVYMNEGQAEEIRETANRYVALLRIEGDLEGAEAVEQHVWNRGYRTGPPESKEEKAHEPLPEETAPEVLPEELAPVEPADDEEHDKIAPIEEEGFEIELESPPAGELETDEVPVLSSPDEPLPEETIIDEVAEGAAPIIEDEQDEAPPAEREPPEPLFVEVEEFSEATIAETIEEPSVSAENEVEDVPFIQQEEAVAESVESPEAEEPAAVVPEADPFGEPGISESYPGDLASSPSMEDLGELDFYIEQELLEEAGNKLETLSARFPMHAEILLRQENLHAARSRIAGTLKAYESVEHEAGDEGEHPAALTHDDVESELIGAFPQDEEIESDSLPFVPEALSDDQELFAAEDDFFDLATELGDDLAEDEAELSELADDDQSLEQIFREFKKGVEQQLDSEDYDTHYNLGIAYKEMGLIDEAIGEFQLASKDPHRAIDGCSMLGLCFLEKGMPQLAIKWYNKGLEMPEISEEEHMGLLYDLGAAYLEVGDIDAAHKAFIEVYGINSKYRDIVGRIKQLEDVRRAT